MHDFAGADDRVEESLLNLTVYSLLTFCNLGQSEDVVQGSVELMAKAFENLLHRSLSIKLLY